MIKNNFLRKRKFWIYLPFRRYLIFVSAIFFLFSGIGFIIDLLSEGSYSEPLLYINVFYSGIVAVFYVYTFTRNLKFLPFTIVFQIVVGINIWKGADPLPLSEFPQRASFDALGILVTIVLGYILLVIFINKEGIRNLRLQVEMNLAQELHSNLVPKIEIVDNRFEIFGISNPTDEVGGDLIDFCENETTHTCYIADVSGHGVAAGSMMGMFKSTIRVLLNKDEALCSILTETSKTIYNLKKKNMFLTCAFLKFNSNSTVEYSTAGHLPILKLANDSNNFDELLIKHLPIAATKDFNYTTNITVCSKNDLFILLTDGITETSNKKDENFGMEKVKLIILNNRNDELSNIYEKINNELTSYGKQKDDQTILLVRCL
ncbi:MAG: serine/threonine-protein phosphatase [Ignavibacteriaceae bacterium]|nr:serine/threonine-protein phosphatase [Ignavibacteriaceae bacterium]